jgi:Fe-S-cluster containining protein
MLSCGLKADAQLIRIIDAAVAESARRSGPWLVCRPGCAECCIGPFPITAADVLRLRQGLVELERRDPERAARVRARSLEMVHRLAREYPGDTVARVLAEDDAAENEPCPALDPETQTCDLYDSRPITCRTFGPPVHFGGESLAACELCYDGATPEQIAACEVVIDADDLEGAGETIVAFALATAITDAEPGESESA